MSGAPTIDVMRTWWLAGLAACHAHALHVDASDAAAEDAVSTADAALPPMVLPEFLVGYNEAWFGDNYATDLTTHFDLAYVDRTFDGIVAANGHVVRLFLFELAEGITWDMSGAPPR